MKLLFAVLTFAGMAALPARWILQAATPNGSPRLIVAGGPARLVLFRKIGRAKER